METRDIVGRPRTAATIVGELPILVAITLVFLVLSNCGHPRDPRDRELAAIVNLKSLVAAQERYAAGCGRGGYADSLSTLASAAAESGTMWQPTSSLAAPEVAALALGTFKGYDYSIGAGMDAVAGPKDCKGRPTTSAWYGSAVPETFGTTGSRSFATNGAATIWQQMAATSPAEPFGPPAIPVQ